MWEAEDGVEGRKAVGVAATEALALPGSGGIRCSSEGAERRHSRPHSDAQRRLIAQRQPPPATTHMAGDMTAHSASEWWVRKSSAEAGGWCSATGGDGGGRRGQRSSLRAKLSDGYQPPLLPSSPGTAVPPPLRCPRRWLCSRWGCGARLGAGAVSDSVRVSANARPSASAAARSAPGLRHVPEVSEALGSSLSRRPPLSLQPQLHQTLPPPPLCPSLSSSLSLTRRPTVRRPRGERHWKERWWLLWLQLTVHCPSSSLRCPSALSPPLPLPLPLPVCARLLVGSHLCCSHMRSGTR